MQPLIFSIGDKTPKIHDSAFIAPGAVVAGDVEIRENASVWYGCVLRGDENKIAIGAGSNIQDGTVIHVDNLDFGGLPTPSNSRGGSRPKAGVGRFRFQKPFFANPRPLISS